jgi:hypothetical protein
MARRRHDTDTETLPLRLFNMMPSRQFEYPVEFELNYRCVLFFSLTDFQVSVIATRE